MDDIGSGIQTILLALCFLSASLDEPESYDDRITRKRSSLLPGAGSTLCGLAFTVFMIFRYGLGGKIMVDRAAIGADALMLVGSILLLWAALRMFRLNSANAGN